MKTKRPCELPDFALPVLACLLLALLSACASPASSQDTAVVTPQPTPAAAATPASPPSTQASPAPAIVDAECKVDADCEVKNVGNCCGYYPACVGKDTPVDPEAVKAQCQSKGMMGVCGFRDISSCQCTAGKCSEAGGSEPMSKKLLPTGS